VAGDLNFIVKDKGLDPKVTGSHIH